MNASVHKAVTSLGKRSFDVLLALALLIVLSPIFLTVALLIRLRLGSPVFFTQERVGLGNAIFRLIKFRSMRNARDAAGNELPDDQRLTKFGRFLRASSLDELPELLNILTGSMSFVGPRPLLTEYLPRYSEEQIRRHEVRPGLTGWAQVNGRNALSWPDRFRLDVWYVDNWSLWLDIKILLRTVGTVLRARDISAHDHASMPKFMG
jgi:lipopolysaccharide/colanic/teichoic acid biosynthesis glycosyltransferase